MTQLLHKLAKDIWQKNFNNNVNATTDHKIEVHSWHKNDYTLKYQRCKNALVTIAGVKCKWSRKL